MSLSDGKQSSMVVVCPSDINTNTGLYDNMDCTETNIPVHDSPLFRTLREVHGKRTGHTGGRWYKRIKTTSRGSVLVPLWLGDGGGWVFSKHGVEVDITGEKIPAKRVVKYVGNIIIK